MLLGQIEERIQGPLTSTDHFAIHKASGITSFEPHCWGQKTAHHTDGEAGTQRGALAEPRTLGCLCGLHSTRAQVA